MKLRLDIFLTFLCATCALFGKELKDSKILICGIARNVEKAVPATIRSIQNIGEHFADYHVIIYENNSTDKTVEKFQEWAKRSPKVTFLTSMWDEEDFYVEEEGIKRRLYRTEVLAYARNAVIDEVLQPKFDDYEYMLMADLDFAKPWCLEGIMSSFEYEGEWDVITANGLVRGGQYADWYALRDDEHPFGPEIYGPRWWNMIGNWRNNGKPALNGSLTPVISAFGGLGIYKRASIVGCRYSGLITTDLETLMQGVMDRGDEKSKKLTELYRNQIRLFPNEVMPGGRIHWFIDTKMKYLDCPTVCEHVPFHATMIHNGHGKIFINPKMVMKYADCL